MEEIKGYITIGPKSQFRSNACIMIYYTPTQEQINNLQKLFGWDFVSIEEAKQLLENTNK